MLLLQVCTYSKFRVLIPEFGGGHAASSAGVIEAPALCGVLGRCRRWRHTPNSWKCRSRLNPRELLLHFRFTCGYMLDPSSDCIPDSRWRWPSALRSTCAQCYKKQLREDAATNLVWSKLLVTSLL